MWNVRWGLKTIRRDQDNAQTRHGGTGSVLEGDSELRAAPAAGRLLTSGEEAAGSSVRTASRPGCKESLARTLM